MQTRFSFLLAFAALFLFSSCSKSNKVGRYIPKSASFVVHINGASVTSKLPWEEVKQNQLFQEIYSDTAMDAVIKAALDNPENTGIDVKNDLMFFIQKDSIGGYAVLQGVVKDADKFKAFYTTATKGTVVSGKDGMNSLSNDKMIATWNKDRFSVLFDVPELNDLNRNRMAMPGMDSSAPAPTPIIKRDLHASSDMIFNLEEKNSLGKEDKFGELVNTKGDIHFWMNITEITSNTPGMAALSMMNLSKLYEGSLFTGTATFEEGKINVDMKSYAGKEMTDLFKKYEGSKISGDMVKRIPSKDVAVLFAMNFKPEGLKEFIKLAGMEGFANMGAGYLGFTLDDFVKANKGDIVLSVSDIAKDTLGKQEANILFSASINDKASFGKLIEAGKKMGKGRFSDSTPPPVFYNTTDNYFAIGNKQSTVDSYIKTAGTNADLFDKISGSPVGAFINFQYIMRAMTPSGSDSLKTAVHNASVQMWDNMIVKGGEFKDGGIIQHMEVNLVDKKVNSLKQLNSYMGVLGMIQKKKKELQKSGMSENALPADSSVVVLPSH